MKKLIFLAVAVSALMGFGGIRATSHDNYGGNTNAWQIKRHYENMAIVTNGGAKVVFIGDSITHRWDYDGSRQQQKYFSQGDWKMLNLGTAADRTEHVLWRLNEGKELDGYVAKCVVLMIGTNNTGHYPIEREPPADTILGIWEIIRTIRTKQPNATLVLLPIFPRGAQIDDPCRARNDIVNKEISKFADGDKILWCDFNDQFLTPDGRVSPELFPDYLHPNDGGFEIWFSAVKPYIAAALSDGRILMPANRYASALHNVRMASDRITTYPESRMGTDEWWLRRLSDNRNQIADAKGKIDIVMIGDSITHRWEKQGKDSLAELRKTYSILNAGYGGDRTEHVLWRLKFGGELDGYKAKCVTLMIGTNNTWHRKDKPEDIAAGVREILDVIVQKQPQAKVVLMPIFPVGDSPKEARRVNNDAVNAIIKGYADGKKVVWLDFTAKFLDEKGDVVSWMPDRVHPDPKGYKEIWMSAILPIFQEVCGK